MTTDVSLLSRRRFGPLFAVQFLGAFNDNLLKFAILFMASFGASALAPDKAAQLAVAATGVFILPYFLLSGIAGQIADTIDKARLVRFVKGAEVGIMAIALAGFWTSSFVVLFAALFLMGVHSTVFGPVKYAILPQHLDEREIMGGTGLVEAGTFVAILAGQLLAGVVPAWEAGVIATGLSVVGFCLALLVPSAPSSSVSTGPIDVNPVSSTRDILRVARGGRGVWLSILGISWFFSVGAVLLAQFAPLVAGTLGGGESAVTLFLLVFSVGVAAGSIVVNRLLQGEVSARYVPVAALSMAAGLIVLWLVSRSWSAPVASAQEFVMRPEGLVLLSCLAVIAVAGGMFVVPLYAILQTSSASSQRARTIAANNVVNAAVTVVLVLAVMVLSSYGTTVAGVVGVLGFSTLAVALISCWLLPETVFKGLVRSILRVLYRV